MPNYNEPIEPIKDPVTMKICRNNSNVSKRRQNIERNRRFVNNYYVFLIRYTF